jgi:hypothetical protein
MRKSGLEWVGLAALATIAGGCASVPEIKRDTLANRIEQNAQDLNEAHTRSLIAIITKNVLRARDDQPTNYTTVSGIKANPVIQSGGSLRLGPLGIGNAPGPFMNSDASLSRNEYADAEYSVNPFASSDNYQSLYEPMAPEILSAYLDSGWDNRILMYMFVDSAELYEAGASSGPRLYIGAGNVSDGAAANPQVTLFHALVDDAAAGTVEFAPIPNEMKSRNCRPYSPRDLVTAFQLTETPPSEIIDTIERLTEKTVVMGTPGEAPPAPGEAARPFNGQLHLCDPPINEWQFTNAADGVVRATVRLRSFDDMVYFLGETLRDYREGPVTFDGQRLIVVREDRKGGGVSVAVDHAGKTWQVAGNANRRTHPDDVSDRTGTVLSLLNQLYLRAQSAEFLRAPDTTLRVR